MHHLNDVLETSIRLVYFNAHVTFAGTHFHTWL